MDLKPEQQIINVKQEDRKTEKKEKKIPQTCPNKVSTFFITVNSNYFVGDKTEEQLTETKNRFVEVLNGMLPQFDKFIEFKTSKMGLKYGYGENDPIEVLVKKDRIIENKLQYVIEISPSTKRLHAHILFFMRKKGVDTKVKIPDLKAHFNNNGFEGSYVNYKLVSTVMSLEEYMRKNPIN